jgi:heme A synthase
MENNLNEPQVALPNATVILVLGIISIVACCCDGLPGTICAIIALVLANTAGKQYTADPARYTESSYNNVKAGKICALIGLIFSLLFIVLIIGMIVTFGWAALSDPTLMQEQLMDIMNR